MASRSSFPPPTAPPLASDREVAAHGLADLNAALISLLARRVAGQIIRGIETESEITEETKTR